MKAVREIRITEEEIKVLKNFRDLCYDEIDIDSTCEMDDLLNDLVDESKMATIQDYKIVRL